MTERFVRIGGWGKYLPERIMPNAEMTEQGMATAAIAVERHERMKTSTTRLARMLPSTKCCLISCSASSM